MDNVTNVIPPPPPLYYTQSRRTKLGLAVVTIQQVGDLYEAIVTITYDNTLMKAEGIFSSAREAYHWAYGVKQETNDSWSGYQEKGGSLVETKPKKNMPARIFTIADALQASKLDYQNFELSKSSGNTGNKVSINAVKASTLLSDDDKAVMAALFAKMGKKVIA